MRLYARLTLLASCAVGLVVPVAVSATSSASASAATLLASLESGSGSGSTVGPGGALFATEPAAGRISRVDPKTGDVTTFASGLPPWVIPGLGGVMDVAFIGDTAYALVSVVSDPILFPTTDIVGIYRIDGPHSYTVVADIGQFAIDNPPTGFDFVVSTGVQYALEPYRGGFLVTDGHHNRVLHVTLDGKVTEMMTFGNIVPTGLEVSGNKVYMAEAGPVPHLPGDGKVVLFEPGSSTATQVASGAPLLVDVERGRGRTLYALSQGVFPVGADPGSPANPDTGSLVRVNDNGTFTAVSSGLDRPTSLELVHNSAFVITLDGELWTIGDVSSQPYGG